MSVCLYVCSAFYQESLSHALSPSSGLELGVEVLHRLQSPHLRQRTDCLVSGAFAQVYLFSCSSLCISLFNSPTVLSVSLSLSLSRSRAEELVKEREAFEQFLQQHHPRRWTPLRGSPSSAAPAPAKRFICLPSDFGLK
jgi:hypothetical protein